MENKKFRTPLKNVKGLGAAKSGTGHFINQRTSAIALVPLVFLFMCVLMRLLTAQTYSEASDVIASPFWVTVLIAFIIAGFYHGALGMQVIIEDYVHAELPKMLLIIALRLVATFLAILGIYSVIHISFFY